MPLPLCSLKSEFFHCFNKYIPFEVNKYVLIEEFATDFPLVSFYTARLDEAELSETEKFIERFLEYAEFKRDFDTIMAWLEKMGNDLGARRIFFRDEEGANALPPRRGIMEQFAPAFVEFSNLRLYCVRVSDQIVILLNGGIKTSEKVQNSPDCLAHFRFAIQVCKQLDKLIQEGEIKIRAKTLELNEPGFYL